MFDFINAASEMTDKEITMCSDAPWAPYYTDQEITSECQFCTTFNVSQQLGLII